MGLSSQYAVGVAAILCQQFDYAIELLEDLHRKLKRVREKEFPTQVRDSVRILKDKTTFQLTCLYIHKSGEIVFRWRKNRQIDELEEAKKYVDKADALGLGSYQGYIFRALYTFVKEGSVRKARKEIESLKKAKVPDSTWAFDEAFLLAYSGHMTSALRYYRMALKRLPTTSSVLVEIEEFILWMLSKEPDKVQLHFCLGLVNYWGKEDLSKATEDFERFLELTDDGAFPEARQLAAEYLDEIKKEKRK